MTIAKYLSFYSSLEEAKYHFSWQGKNGNKKSETGYWPAPLHH
jgi:hypothetical protein